MNFKALKRRLDGYPNAKRALSYLRYRSEAWHCLTAVSGGRQTGPVLFTTQKCASTFITQALKVVQSEYRLRACNLEGFFWQTRGLDTKAHLQRDADKLFSGARTIFAPIRDYVKIKNEEHRSIVLMLRDPRDVLVSAYYSVSFSHVLPGGAEAQQRFSQLRKRALEMTLDEYVIFALDEYLPKYMDYARHLLGRPNVTFVTYEEMATDFTSWADKFLAGLGLETRDDAISKLRAVYLSGAPASGIEDTTSHRRQGRPGDFRRKLSGSTIAVLNERLDDVMSIYGCWE